MFIDSWLLLRLSQDSYHSMCTCLCLQVSEATGKNNSILKMTAQEGEGWGGISILTNMFGISVNIDFKYETQVYL